MSNASVVLYGAGRARIEDRPIPEIDDPHDVVVRIACVGVCGSDVHFWVEGGIGAHTIEEGHPWVMGHEASGIVYDVGSAVASVKKGDRVAIEPSRPCRHCVRCKQGFYNLCPHMAFAASGPEYPGTLAKFYRTPEDWCYKLPDAISLEEGLFAEPLSVAAHAVRMVNVRPGDTVVVFGAGTIGALSAAVARMFGARKTVVVDLLERRLDFVRELTEGEAETFRPDMNLDAAQNANLLMEEHGLGEGADAVIEATGAESCINTAIFALRPGGHMIQTGLGKRNINFPITELSEKEIHLHGACRYGPGDYAVAMDVLERGLIGVKKLISKTFPFEKATSAWEATRRGEGIKNLIAGVVD